MRHIERHQTSRVRRLRAAVLGANDGIVSTASLKEGVAAASASQGSILLTGVAGLLAGAMSMAAGEYVSVHAQADTKQADIASEAAEIKEGPTAEHDELAAIYVGRGPDHVSLIASVTGPSQLFLALLGVMAARAGGANILSGA